VSKVEVIHVFNLCIPDAGTWTRKWVAKTADSPAFYYEGSDMAELAVNVADQVRDIHRKGCDAQIILEFPEKNFMLVRAENSAPVLFTRLAQDEGMEFWESYLGVLSDRVSVD